MQAARQSFSFNESICYEFICQPAPGNSGRCRQFLPAAGALPGRASVCAHRVGACAQLGSAMGSTPFTAAPAAANRQAGCRCGFSSCIDVHHHMLPPRYVE